MLAAECAWHERTADGYAWQDMPGSSEDLKKMNFALYRRLPQSRRRAWMRDANREAREEKRDSTRHDRAEAA